MEGWSVFNEVVLLINAQISAKTKVGKNMRFKKEKAEQTSSREVNKN